MREAVEGAREIADRSTPVSIVGAAGTGKTALAKWIHHLGRPGKPFVSISCRERFDAAALSEKISEARDGTLLIEDIDVADPFVQGLLADQLDQSVQRSCRWIVTSRKDLRALARQELFRQDLYYKLTVVTLTIPSLADRREDIAELAAFFLDVQGILHGRKELQLSGEAIEKLAAGAWTGNLRELESVLERAVVTSPSGAISADKIRFEETPQASPKGQDFGPGMSLSEVERRLILQTLELTAQNRTKAAQILGISIRTLRNKLNEYRGGEVGV